MRIRTNIFSFAAAIFGIAVLPAISQWFIELADSYGAYDNPQGDVDGAMSFVESILSHPYYYPTLTLLFGALLGITAYWIAGKIDRKDEIADETFCRFEIGADLVAVVEEDTHKNMEMVYLEGEEGFAAPLLSNFFESVKIHLTNEQIELLRKRFKIHPEIRSRRLVFVFQKQPPKNLELKYLGPPPSPNFTFVRLTKKSAVIQLLDAKEGFYELQVKK